MRNVLIYGSYTAPNNVEFYTDALGNHYIIPAMSSLDDEQPLPFIATVREEKIDIDYIPAQEIMMIYKDVSTLRKHVIAQMELDNLNKLTEGRA